MPKKPRGDQRIAIPEASDNVQISFNLEQLDNLVRNNGQEFIHYTGIPSPIGMRDRGDYRRSGELDVQASNGMLYECAGQITGALTGNAKSKKNADGGDIDASVGYFTCGRFYDADGEYQNGERIYFQPGDRLYIKNKEIDMKVVATQYVEYSPDRDTVLQYPALKVNRVVDSKGQKYYCGKDFKISDDGNLSWLPGGNRPGIEPSTGKGLILGVRYLYDAHWYVTRLIHEVRMANVTEGEERKEERMPYFVEVCREYIYHNRNNGDQTKPNPKIVKEDKSRAIEKPIEKQDSPHVPIRVQMSDIEDE